ncbi:MAG: lytic transglycosylase domain-containing protein [Candidatus Thiodiazotropha weberae]|nr:lytic transglycosylase domain-containing protein [Candidatus Thiodiazotropha endoloripes]MCG7899726.1 lytic transglycosylase domain-containing protein [Candidatus Thiodiazotropha weberae]
MKRNKGMMMRHEVLKLFAITALVFSNQIAYCSPYQFNYDMVGDSHRTFPLPAGYIRPKLLESSPIRSKLLDLYGNQGVVKPSDLSHSKRERSFADLYDPVGYEENNRYRINKTVPNHRYVEDIFIVSLEYNIDPLLLHAIAEIESAFNAEAVSKAGAKGLMQVMPDTARRFGMQNPHQELLNPISNLRISSNYIRSLYSLFGNNIPLILAAYNAGENAVIKYGYRIPPYKETENYVKKVMKRYLQLKDKSVRL